MNNEFTVCYEIRPGVEYLDSRYKNFTLSELYKIWLKDPLDADLSAAILSEKYHLKVLEAMDSDDMDRVAQVWFKFDGETWADGSR